MKTTSARGMMAGRQPTDMPAASLFEISGNGNNYIGSARGLHAFEQSQCSVSVHGIHTHVKTLNLSTRCVRNRLVARLSTSCNKAVILSSCYKVVTHNSWTNC